MADRSDRSQDSDSDHDDIPNVPLPVWLTASSPIRRGVPSYRAGHSLVAFSNRLYLFGGYCDYAAYANACPSDEDMFRGIKCGIGLHFNTLHEFSYDRGEWRLLHRGCWSSEARNHDLPIPRRHASLVVHGGSLFVYGGFDVDDMVLDDLWEFNLEAATWNLVIPPSPEIYDPSRRCSIPAARAEHTAVTYANTMVIFGGYDGKKKLNDTYVYNFETKTWLRPPTAEHNSPSRRCKHSAVVYNKKMYITGGFQYKDGDNYALTDMHALDLESNVWTSILMGTGAPEALQGHKAVVCGDSMYILGGKIRNRHRNSMPSHSTIPSTLLATMPFAPSTDHQSMSLSQLPSQSHVDMSIPPHLNPDNRTSGLNSTVYRYLFDANKWLSVETSGHTPNPRQLHAAVALPTGGGRGSIFVFGGTDKGKSRFFNDLAELRGIRITPDYHATPCLSCSSYSILVNNPIFSDVTFILEGKEIHAHRAILYARSEYFRHMFDSSMRESSETEIPIPNVSYEVFRALLEYLYCGKVGITHGRLAVDLLKVADMFRIDGLRNLCVEKVEQAVTVANAAFICQVADTHNAQHLKTYCITFMMQNFRDVIKTESFQSLMRTDPGGLGHEILDAYSDISPYSSGLKRARK